MEDNRPLKERLSEENYKYLCALCDESLGDLDDFNEQIAKEREQELTTEELIRQAKLANSWGEVLGNNTPLYLDKDEDEDE